MPDRDINGLLIAELFEEFCRVLPNLVPESKVVITMLEAGYRTACNEGWGSIFLQTLSEVNQHSCHFKLDDQTVNALVDHMIALPT